MKIRRTGKKRKLSARTKKLILRWSIVLVLILFSVSASFQPDGGIAGLENTVANFLSAGLQNIAPSHLTDTFLLTNGKDRFRKKQVAGLDYPVLPRGNLQLILTHATLAGGRASLVGYLTYLNSGNFLDDAYYYDKADISLVQSNGDWKIAGVSLKPMNLYSYFYRLPSPYNPAHAYPLIVFLHGSDQNGDDLNLLEHTHGFLAMQKPEVLDQFLIAMPLCPPATRWVPSVLMRTVAKMRTEHRVDPSRIYLMGFSLGADGVWNTASRFPEYFAAAVPVSGYVRYPEKAAALLRLPIWVFHSTDDPFVPFTESQGIVNRLKGLGHTQLSFTVFEGEGHFILPHVVNTPELFFWILNAHR